MAKHIYILDTCVLLHDPMAIYKFQEHDVYLPLAVIDDLDEIKTRRDTVGWSAREVFRILDEFDESQLTKGVKVNDAGGKLFIFNTEAPLSRNDKPFVCRVNSDNAIIDACLNLKSQYPKRKVAIITKDTGLRVRALSWTCQAENYRADLLEDSIYTGIRYIPIDNSSDWDDLWHCKDLMKDIKSFPASISSQLEKLAPNEFVFFKYGESICPAMHKKGSLKIMKDKSNGVNHGKPEYKGIQAKNIEQKCAIEILADENIPLVCLLGPAGTGKAQPLYSSILTPGGFKTNGETVIGDIVIGGDGKQAMVTGVFPQGVKKVYKVSFSDGASTECCEEHLWTVQDEYQRWNGKSSTLELKEIMLNLKGHDGRKNYSIPVTDVEFEARELPLDPYAIGLLIGDGGLTTRTPIFSTSDDELLFSLSKELPNGVRPVHKKDSYDYYLSSGRNNGVNPLTHILRNLNLMGKNSWNKFIPYEYLHTSKEHRIALLQGLMDTDGTIDHRNGKHVTFNTVSEQLAEDLIWLVRSLGGVCKRKYKKSTWTYNGIKITRGKSINITLNLPPDVNPFRLERKKNKVIPKTKYKPTRYIESVEEVGETECQCIMVDNDSHLYITDDFIVTHNTILTLAIGLDYIDKGIYDRIIVIKPLIPVGGKDIGALPGDKWEKLSAWLGPMRDNIEQLVQEKTNNSSKHMQASGASFEELVQEGKIEVEAMAFIQGRSIPNSLVIVDECLTAGHLVYTADGMAIPIENIKQEDVLVSFDTNTSDWVNNKSHSQFNRKTKELVVIKTGRGEIECTATHQLWVYEHGERLVKKAAKDVQAGDLLPVPTEMPHVVKNNLNEKEARLISLILTDGHVEKTGYRIKIEMSKDKEWLKQTFEDITTFWESSPVLTFNNNRNSLICALKDKRQIENFCQKYNIPMGKKSSNISIPLLIWNAPKESVASFIQMAFDAEGDVNVKKSTSGYDNVVVSFSTCSKLFAYGVQALLLKFGIDSHVYTYKKNNVLHNTGYRVSIINGMAIKYANLIGFSINRKQEKLLSANVNLDSGLTYPLKFAKDLKINIPNGSRWKSDFNKSDFEKELGYLPWKNKSGGLSQTSFNKMIAIAERENISTLKVPACSAVKSVKHVVLEEEVDVYDFTVEDTHTFVVNGVVSSNCQNLIPREARMVVERCGKGSKVVFLGDLSQVENPFLDARSCGLAHAVNGGRMQPACGTVTLSKVERSELAAIASVIFSSPESRR